MQIYMIIVSVVHFAFAIFEMFPWPNPVLLRILSKALPELDDADTVTPSAVSRSKPKFSAQQQQLVATIVHNAGIYNAVVAGALLWAAIRGEAAYDFALVLFVGVAAAGGFGTATIRSPITAGQCLLGIIGAAWLTQM